MNMSRRRVRAGVKFSLLRFLVSCIVVAIVLCALCGVRVAAQATSGVTGVVTDPSGAVVAGASVKLTNAATGFAAETKTNSAGIYQFLLVPPGGKYTLTFSSANFRTLHIEDVALGVGVTETRNAELQIGDTRQTVEVVAQGEATLDTTDASIGTTVDGNRVQDLPSLFVDNAAALLELAPGVVATGNDSQQGVVTGTRGDQSNITLDGLDVNDQRTGEAFVTVVNTPLDSVQEVRTTVGGEDASYGHSAGGQVELVTKSGTNTFHGEAYDFNRVTVFAANDYFNNLQGIPRPPLIRNQFGGDVGGPILKDKLFFFFTYNGLRTKASQEIDQTVPLDALQSGQLNYLNGSGVVVATPLTGTNSLVALDPSGIGADPSLLSLFKTRPYPEHNNFAVGDGINSGGYEFVAPVNDKDNTFVGRLDYQITKAHRLFARGTWDRSVDDDSINHVIAEFPGDPTPEATITDHSRSWVVGDTWTVSPTMTNQATFGETNSVLVFPLKYDPTFPNLLSFFYNGTVITDPYNGERGFNEQFPIVPVYQVRDTFIWARGKHTFQFGGVVKPTIFKSGNLTDYNTFTVGLGGNITALNPSFRPSDISSSSVYQSEWDAFFPLALGRFSSVNAGYNYSVTGNALPQGLVANRDYHSTEYEFFGQDVWNIRSDLTMTYGLRWEFHNPLSEINGFEAIPNLSESQLFSDRVAAATAGTEGPTAIPFVTYGLGGSANHARGYYSPDYKNFAPRLGLAYSPSSKGGFLGSLLGNRKSSIRAGFGIDYDVNLIGQGFELDETSFLFSNSVVTSYGQSGVGTAFLPVAQGGDPRFSGLSTLPAVPPGGTTPRPTFAPNIDANGVPIGFGTNFGFGSGALYNFDPNYKTPYEMHFSLDIQRELPGNWLVDVGYLGKLGRRLTAVGDPAQTLNFKDATSGQLLYTAFGAVQKQLQAGTPVGSLTSQPWFENQVGAAVGQLFPGQTCLSETGFDCTNLTAAIVGPVWPDGDVSSTLVGLALIHPTGNPELSLLPLNVGLLAQDGAAAFVGNFSSSTYHSLFVRVNHRLSHDFTMELDYAFSHSIDNSSDIQNELIEFSATGAAEVCDLRNLRVCRGNSNFDATHLASANFEYGLPFGRGRRVAPNASKLLDEAIGGWKVSGIVIAHTGFPFKIDTGTWPIDFTQSAPAVFVGTQGDVKGGVHVVPSSGPGVAPTVQFFSNETNAIGAFQFPFGGGTGNRNVVRGPGYWNTDLALLKDFTMPWSDDQKLEFRAEAFNAFNHVNFSPPGASLLSPVTFGNISSDVNGPRVLQLALKYSF